MRRRREHQRQGAWMAAVTAVGDGRRGFQDVDEDPKQKQHFKEGVNGCDSCDSYACHSRRHTPRWQKVMHLDLLARLEVRRQEAVAQCRALRHHGVGTLSGKSSIRVSLSSANGSK
ncbi:hypothetical protein OAO87_01535 [bacterium]|nr:hypothetical protein [bacterium]